MKKILLIFMYLLLFICKSSWATCTINSPTTTTPMPLQMPNIAGGADLPDGTVLYKQTYNVNFQPGGGNYIDVTCTSSETTMANYTYSQTPLPLSGYGGGELTGKVYETGVPGVGIYIASGVQGGTIFPGSHVLTSNPDGSAVCQGSCNVIGNFKRWDVYLIKTGTISPGTIIGSSLPCTQVNYTNDVNSASNMVANICLSGSINVIASSCKTPDVTVAMGSYPVTSLTGKNSTTGWIDASIKLTDCPVFYGFGASGNWYADSSGTNGSGTPTNNKLELKLTPNTSVIDSGNGVFAINSGTDSATGVGIQLAYGSSASPNMVDFGGTNSYEMTNGSSGNVTLPLVARYIQTDTNVSPGLANSAVTFLINYY